MAGLERLAPIDSGQVDLPDVPAGTWEISLRALGYAPKTVVVDAPLATPMTVALQALPHLLDSMVIRSKASIKDDRVLHEIRERLKVAGGTLITADNLSVRNSIDASDAVAVAKGFIWKGATNVTARARGKGECKSAPHADAAPRKGGPTIAIYLDGNRVPGGLEMVNRMVPPSDILAIEAYPDVASAPFLWRTDDACAVIAFWTKHLGR
jgi:hypothetical protein